jgi:hypothetical protein
MKQNMVCSSSSGTQARACMWLANSPLGAWVQNGNALNEADPNLVLWQVEDLKAGELGWLGARTHVNPNYAGALDHLVGLGLHLLHEAGRRNAWHIHAIAGNIELPAVIDAAQAARLVAAEKQRGATVRTAMVHHADPAVAVAKGDELFAEQHQAHGGTIALEL